MLKISRLVLKEPRLRINRGFSTTAKLKSERSLLQLKKKQAEYQCEDGRPIYLKEGLSDRVLYTSTLVLACVGVANTLMLIYDYAKPQSWKTPVC